jgi:hypothetical protein
VRLNVLRDGSAVDGEADGKTHGSGLLWTGDPAASWFKHDMIRVAAPGQKPLIFVLMTQGKRLASDVPDAFARIGRYLFDELSGDGA